MTSTSSTLTSATSLRISTGDSGAAFSGTTLSNLEFDASWFTDRVYATSEEAVKVVRQRAVGMGFAIKKKNDNRRRTSTKEPTRFYYECAKSGVYSANNWSGTSTPQPRRTTTNLTGCPWKLSIAQQSNGWIVVVTSPLHNHIKTKDVRTQPLARVMLPEYREIIAQHFNQSATARTTLTALAAKYPECLLLNRDIYNEWQSLRKAQLRGRTPMEFLLDTLRAENSTFSIKLDRNNRCSQLLLLPQQTKELSREFGQVIQLDSTYNTNWYKMPLLHFVGSTNTDNTFTVAICFMTSKTTGDYLWGLSEFKRLSGINISPNVIVTDRELALINAIKIVYPRATHVLCSWHIEKNILSNCKKYFPTKFQVGESAFAYLVTWDDFLVSWSRLISEVFDVEEFNHVGSHQAADSSPSVGVHLVQLAPTMEGALLCTLPSEPNALRKFDHVSS